MKQRKFLRKVLGLLMLLAAIFPFLPFGCVAASDAAEGGPFSPEEAVRRANVPEGNWIWIDLPQKTLTLYQGTTVLKRYSIASGTWATPSPIGTFYITHRFAGDLGGFGTRFLGLNVPWGQYGIHGTNRPGSIGSNASHGCIRLLNKDSEELYGKVGNWSKVVIQGGPYGLLDSSLRALRPGDRSSHVAAVQRKLISMGYLYGNADGIYGSSTADAVRRARKALGLRAGDDVDAAFYQAVGLILFE